MRPSARRDADPKRSAARARKPDARAKASPPTRRTRRGALSRFLRRRPWAMAAGLVGLHLVLALLAFEPTPHPGGDNATYLALARSLLDGGYRDVFDPAAPAHTQFPPGFPAILAVALALGLKPWAGIKLVIVFFSALAVALTYFWIRRRRRPELAAGVALLVAMSPGVLDLSHWELSDVPFWALTMAALLAWERLGRRDNRRGAAASAASAAAYLVRSAGLPLLLAAGLWLALRRRWAQLGIFAALVLPPAAAWWMWGRAHQGYGQLILAANAYAPSQGTVDAAGLVARMAANVGEYLGRHLPVLMTGQGGGLGMGLAIGVVLLAAYGWARRARRPGVAELFLPLYLGVLLVWPTEWSGERLLLPVYPALLLYAGDAVARLSRVARFRAAPAASLAAAGLLFLFALPGLSAELGNGMECTGRWRDGERYPCQRPDWRDFFETAELTKRAVPDGSVVISRKPALFHAVSGLSGRNYPLDREPEKFFAAAREAGARYVVLDYLDQVAPAYLMPILVRRPQAFCVMHSYGDERATLFGIRAGADTLRDLRGDPGESTTTVGFTFCPPEFWRDPAVREEMLGPMMAAR